MRVVKVNKTELLEIVRKNQISHVAQYDEAVADYKALALQIAKDNMKLAKKGTLADIAAMSHMPSPPVSYEAAYTRAIRMLEMSVENVLELEEYIFNQLVMDEWDWKQAFSTSNTMYKTAIGSAR